MIYQSCISFKYSGLYSKANYADNDVFDGCDIHLMENTGEVIQEKRLVD